MPANRAPDERRGTHADSASRRLLLIDSDPWCRALADGALRAQGYRVACTGDLDAAARVALELAPDLLIVDVRIPVLDVVPIHERRNSDRARIEPFPLVDPAYCVLRPLELEPSGGVRPVVTLKPGADGADIPCRARFAVLGYISKPFTPYSVIRHLESYLGRLRVASPLPGLPHDPAGELPAAPAFEGSVEVLGVPAILEIFHFNQLSGVCSFEAPGGRSAEVHFQSGEVIGARIEDGSKGADAIFRLVSWTEGRFSFRVRSFDEDARKLLRFEQMMLEGMRRLDEQQTFPFEMMGLSPLVGSS